MRLMIESLTDKDVSRGVVYVPLHGPREDGVITSWNKQFVFVRYRGREHSQATSPEDLEWQQEE